MADARLPRERDGPAPEGAGELGRRVVSGLVLALAALVAAWFGGYVFLLFCTLGAAAVWWEWTAMAAPGGRLALLAIGGVALVAIAFALAADAPALAFACAVVGAGVAIASAQTARLWVGGGLIYVSAGLIPAIMLRADPAFGLVAILWLFAVVWAEDTGAYFAGRAVGGPKLAPGISPSKTWAGALGGTLAGIVAGNAVILLAGIEWRPAHVLVALAVVVVAQFGDLVESALKRRFGVKDSGTLIPGHGGMMDRVDGFIFAAAAALAIGLAWGGAAGPARGLLLW